MKSSSDFRAALRGGVRTARPTLVVHARTVEPVPGRHTQSPPTRVGFVVSKAVGNAVTRNRVKRRLRALVEDSVRSRPTGCDVVVRALPPAAEATFHELAADWNSAWSKARVKAGGSADSLTGAHS